MNKELPMADETKPHLSRAIIVGDRIKLAEGKGGPYKKAYGIADDATWVVKGQSFVQGRRRLVVEGSPSFIWAGDARPAYGWESSERREHLAAQGIKAA